MRPSSRYMIFFSLAAVAMVALLVLHPVFTRGYYQVRTKALREAVQTLHLTDLCLFTEARYTRNISLADLNSAFQDHPLAFEHFPSGSMVSPPRWRFESNGAGIENRESASQ